MTRHTQPHRRIQRLAPVFLALLGLTGCITLEAPMEMPAPTAPEPAALMVKQAPKAEVIPARQVVGSARDAALVGLAATLPDVAETAVRSVVSVGTRRVMTSAFPGRMASEQQGVGSGVIIRGDGIVVTNNHVIEGATEMMVSLPDGQMRDARVLGADPRSDLAVLQIVDPPPGLQPLPFGDSDGLRLGEVVLAVGTPFGIGQTVTMGIVSAKGRSDVGIVDYEDFIQTDAAINPGNSGGALVDLDGTLIGINTAIFSRSGGSQGIGFAIPASMASHVVEQIINTGTVRRGWLGVAIQDLTPQQQRTLGVPNGVLIAGVEPGSPAAAAGFKAGDVVVRFQGEAVSTVANFRHAVAETGAEADFAASVLRQGDTVAVDGVLGVLAAR